MAGAGSRAAAAAVTVWRRVAAVALAVALLPGPWSPDAVAQAPPLACPPQAQPLAAAQAAQAGRGGAHDRGLLWRIVRDGRSSYLYGTVHVARAEWLAPGPQTLRALEASDTVALELDVFDAEVQRRLAVGMRADPSERLDEGLRRRLRVQSEAACLPREVMDALAPAVQLALLTTLAARWDGLDPAYAIDAFLAADARARGLPVRSLETPELQLALLKDDASPAAMARALDQFERGQVRPLLLRIAQVWEQGDEATLARYAQWCGCADTPEERAALKRVLDDRNPALAARIDALHASGQRVFAAVGALHMVGPAGLPALLAARGYEVQRIEAAR